MARCISLSLAFLFVSLLAQPMFAQDGDRAHQAKRIAEIEKEISELKTRLEILNADLYKLKEAAKPVFKEEYMASPDAKRLRGKWQAVRVTWGGDMVAEESLAKIQLEFSDQGYHENGMRVKILDREKKAYEANLPEKTGIWAIDPTTHPKTIGFWRERQNLAERFPIYGIYKLEGDTLSICWGSFRQASAKFDDTNISVYKRPKDEPKKTAK